tara:strand:- start:12563 stop:14950 length:2388 start_codon:yes stop_codon:yes gene_type:complete
MGNGNRSTVDMKAVGALAQGVRDKKDFQRRVEERYRKLLGEHPQALNRTRMTPYHGAGTLPEFRIPKPDFAGEILRKKLLDRATIEVFERLQKEKSDPGLVTRENIRREKAEEEARGQVPVEAESKYSGKAEPKYSGKASPPSVSVYGIDPTREQALSRGMELALSPGGGLLRHHLQLPGSIPASSVMAGISTEKKRKGEFSRSQIADDFFRKKPGETDEDYNRRHLVERRAFLLKYLEEVDREKSLNPEQFDGTGSRKIVRPISREERFYVEHEQARHSSSPKSLAGKGLVERLSGPPIRWRTWGERHPDASRGYYPDQEKAAALGYPGFDSGRPGNKDYDRLRSKVMGQRKERKEAESWNREYEARMSLLAGEEYFDSPKALESMAYRGELPGTRGSEPQYRTGDLGDNWRLMEDLRGKVDPYVEDEVGAIDRLKGYRFPGPQYDAEGNVIEDLRAYPPGSYGPMAKERWLEPWYAPANVLWQAFQTNVQGTGHPLLNALRSRHASKPAADSLQAHALAKNLVDIGRMAKVDKRKLYEKLFPGKFPEPVSALAKKFGQKKAAQPVERNQYEKDLAHIETRKQELRDTQLKNPWLTSTRKRTYEPGVSGLYSDFGSWVDDDADYSTSIDRIRPSEWSEYSQSEVTKPLEFGQRDKDLMKKHSKALEEALEKSRARSSPGLSISSPDPLSTSLAPSHRIVGSQRTDERREKRDLSNKAKLAGSNRRKALEAKRRSQRNAGNDDEDRSKERWEQEGYRSKTAFLMRGAAGHQNQRGGRRGRSDTNPFDIDTAHLHY